MTGESVKMRTRYPRVAARQRGPTMSSARRLPAMADVDDVAVFDDVFFAFDVELAGFLELHFGGMTRISGGGDFSVLHDLGADETAGDVGMDGVRGFDGGGAVADGPG